ncbi:hypothetical protein GGS23DRAFT_271404 [Durotheca rogersii]|uniref:uncharacterized protein n=1 Tax=Durotheca rogersii TaxID=419775 RepID=UPI0022207A75|nr:uncharacterized protein GGS23DRAFT_271404 [Durotheca rogersii]KAI5866434.1 hypothetical protein GGS23DRAFT_271404 [Durotheca rogersii]
MALNVKHLNSDASFLLSFEPIIPEFLQGTVTPRPFTILLDPWITGPSTVFHSKISIATNIHPACLSSLSELPAPPDLVIISQNKSDHCNEATLRQLPATGTETLILAEPAAARLIRSWKYFDPQKVRTIERWEDPRVTGRQSVVRVPVPAVVPGGQAGEVTVAFIPQKRDFVGLHAAIGITYRPPSTHNLQLTIPIVSKPPSPPATPKSLSSPTSIPPASHADTLSTDTLRLPPTPPVSPRSLRPVRSATTLLPSPPTRLAPSPPLSQPPHSSSSSHDLHIHIPPNRPATSSGYGGIPLTAVAAAAISTRPLSVLFSPHGIAYAQLSEYATSHLVSEAALPLTALLHCIDTLANPWWLGGNVCAGAPAGAETATRLGARVWIGAHDGIKDVRGLGTSLLRTRRFAREEVESALQRTMMTTTTTTGRNSSHSREKGEWKGGEKKRASRGTTGSSTGSRGGAVGTEVLRLGSGDGVLVSGTGALRRYTKEGGEEEGEDLWAASSNGAGTSKARRREESKAKLHSGEVPEQLKPKKSLRGGLSLRFKTTTVPPIPTT